jgi:hypothetical protein
MHWPGVSRRARVAARRAGAPPCDTPPRSWPRLFGQAGSAVSPASGPSPLTVAEVSAAAPWSAASRSVSASSLRPPAARCRSARHNPAPSSPRVPLAGARRWRRGARPWSHRRRRLPSRRCVRGRRRLCGDRGRWIIRSMTIAVRPRLWRPRLIPTGHVHPVGPEREAMSSPGPPRRSGNRRGHRTPRRRPTAPPSAPVRCDSER